MTQAEKLAKRIRDARTPEQVVRTDKALCVVVGGEEVWIPRSQIHDDSEVWDEGHEGTLVIPQWLAEAKGIA